MPFVTTIGLVIVGAALLVVGLLTSSSWAFIGAAAASLVAVVVLWRYVGRTNDKVRVTDAPPVAVPQWNDSLRDVPEPQPEDDHLHRTGLPPVAIDQYEDMVASEIMPSLETLSIEQLQAVIQRERAGLARPIIISRAETLIDLTRNGGRDDLDLRDERATLGPDGKRRQRGLEQDKGFSLE